MTSLFGCAAAALPIAYGAGPVSMLASGDSSQQPAPTPPAAQAPPRDVRPTSMTRVAFGGISCPCIQGDLSWTAEEADACTTQSQSLIYLSNTFSTSLPAVADARSDLRICIGAFHVRKEREEQELDQLNQRLAMAREAADHAATAAPVATYLMIPASVTTEPVAAEEANVSGDPSPAESPARPPTARERKMAADAKAAREAKRAEARAAGDAERARAKEKREDEARAAAEAEAKSNAEACGPAPTISAWDGIPRGVEPFFKRLANDPDSVEFIECTRPNLLPYPTCWSIVCHVRAKNALGAKIVKRIAFGKNPTGWGKLLED